MLRGSRGTGFDGREWHNKPWNIITANLFEEYQYLDFVGAVIGLHGRYPYSAEVKQGQVTWWPFPGSFSIPPDLPQSLYPQPSSAATELSFYQVSAGLENFVWAVDGYCFAYELDKDGKRWTYRGRWLNRVAVFDSRLVLGIFVNRPGEHYGDLQRYDYATQKWISVDKGSLGSNAKFKYVAVGGAKDAEEIWAVANLRPKQYLTSTDEEIAVVRYDGNIIEGKGDWQVMAISSAALGQLSEIERAMLFYTRSTMLDRTRRPTERVLGRAPDPRPLTEAHHFRQSNLPIGVGDEIGPMHELGISGRSQSGEICVYGMLPKFCFRDPQHRTP
jgi:hypothetical protein